jgi:hypothetical protein
MNQDHQSVYLFHLFIAVLSNVFHHYQRRHSSELSFHLCDKWENLDSLFLLPVNNSDLSFPCKLFSHYFHCGSPVKCLTITRTNLIQLYPQPEPDKTWHKILIKSKYTHETQLHCSSLLFHLYISVLFAKDSSQQYMPKMWGTYLYPFFFHIHNCEN